MFRVFVFVSSRSLFSVTSKKKNTHINTLESILSHTKHVVIQFFAHTDYIENMKNSYDVRIFWYFDCSTVIFFMLFFSFVMHHPICFNWKAKSEKSTAEIRKIQRWLWRFGAPACQSNIPYALMIREQWLVAHYSYFVIGEKDIWFDSNIQTYCDINKQ